MLICDGRGRAESCSFGDGGGGCIEPCVLPQPVGNRQRINLDTPPPCDLCAMPVQFAVVDAAQRDSELITDLAAERPRLGKAQMVGIRW